MDPKKVKLIFFGSDRFSIKILDYLIRKKVCNCFEIVTSNPKCLLSKYSQSNKLICHSWPLVNGIISNNKWDIGLVASFGHLIDVNTVERFGLGLFNVHPSLLPQYRGSTPIQRAILDGVPETGCTIMKIPPVPKFDIGEIVLQERLRIKHREYAADLIDRLADLGSNLSERLLLDYDRCTQNIRPQTGEPSSYAKKLKPEMGLIQFKKESSDLIDRKFRAYTSFIDLFTYCFKKNHLKVRLEGLMDLEEIENLNLDDLCIRLLKQKSSDAHAVEPGTIYFHKPRQILCIKCADRKWLGFTKATPEHRPQMSSLDFYNGYLSAMKVEALVTDV